MFVTMCQMITRNPEFPQWLQNQLDIRHWKPTDLAKKSRLADATISRILKSERQADIDSLIAIAEAFNMSLVAIIKTAFIFPSDDNENVNWEDWKVVISQMTPQEEMNIKRMATFTVESRQKEEKSARASRFTVGKVKK